MVLGCPQKGNGNMPVEQEQRRRFLLETKLPQKMLILGILVNQWQLGNILRMLLAFMTCMEMCGNGEKQNILLKNGFFVEGVLKVMIANICGLTTNSGGQKTLKTTPMVGSVWQKQNS